MGAVPDAAVTTPDVAQDATLPPVAARQRRFVALAVTAMELLRPCSDLVRLVEGAAHVDVLLAAEDEPAREPAALGVLTGSDARPPDRDCADADLEDRADDPPDDGPDDVASGVAVLGLAELHVHRLRLPTPLGAQAGDDLVAALSELVGFDPEPGVYLLAPARPGADDPQGAVVEYAVGRIAQVYGIPLLRYRCHELSIVGSG